VKSVREMELASARRNGTLEHDDRD
jgi:hypothetical protein